MAHKRTWYNKYIGYQFCYNGRGITLLDTFHFEGDNGKKSAGFEMKFEDERYSFVCDLKSFKEYISQTVLPE